MNSLTFGIQNKCQQNSTTIFPFVKGKLDRAMYDFSRTHDSRKKGMLNFRDLLFIKSN